MKVNRERLLRQLQAVGPGLASKGIIEQSTSIAFRGGRASTFNDEVACSIAVGLDFEGAVDSDKLLKLLAKLTEEEVEVELTGGELVVRGVRRRAGIRVEPEIVMPEDTLEKPERWRKLPEDLVEAMSVVSHCCSSKKSQEVLVCVHVAPEWVEASDRFQVCRWLIVTGLKDSLLIRQSSLRAVIGCAPMEWAKTENWLHFRGEGGLTVACRLYAAMFPDVGEYLEATGVSVKLPKGLGEAVDKAALFVEQDAVDMVKIELRPDKLKVTGRGPLGWFSEVLDVGYAGDPLSFVVAPKLMQEVLRKSGEVRVETGRLSVMTDKWRYVTCTGVPEAEA